jgi:hypothetical protein
VVVEQSRRPRGMSDARAKRIEETARLTAGNLRTNQWPT